MALASALPDELLQVLNAGQGLRSMSYRGRFAPSPTGPLHLGNLRTAVISWLRARLEGGKWLLRVDDLDVPRNRLGATESIKKDLLWLGLDWDGPIVFQSERIDLYCSFLAALKLQGKLYPCQCSRRMLGIGVRAKDKPFIYPGTCRHLNLSWERDSDNRLPSLRLKVREQFSTLCGDIVLKRADGFIAYHLATVVDELTLGISEVVRGLDLAHAISSQLAIIDALNQRPVSYKHVPLVLDLEGRKLSKRFGGRGLQYFKNKGMSASEVLGLLASSLDLVPIGTKLNSYELLEELKKRKQKFERIIR